MILQAFSNTASSLVPDDASGKKRSLVSTLNAHSYNLAKTDCDFFLALQQSNVLLADGIAVVWAYKFLGKEVRKIAGADLFAWEMERLNETHGSCFFLGSIEATLEKIQARMQREYPNVKVGCYSPPYKPEFSEEDNQAMVNAVNAFEPDVLFIGMTAPKQEKWAHRHFEQLKAQHVCCIGAVFDFYAGTVNRPPKWMINLGLEWLGRLIKEPKRMWRRYLLSSPVIFIDVFKYKMAGLFRRKQSSSVTTPVN